MLLSATGSTFPNVSGPDLNDLEIDLPHLPEQHSIASILSSLDDKMFVEEAKEGWGTGKLRDVIEMIYGKALKEDIRTGTGFPVAGLSGIVGYH